MSAQVSKTALPQVTDEGGGSEIYESETHTSETIAKWAQVRAYGFTVAGLYLLAPVGLYCELVNESRNLQKCV